MKFKKGDNEGIFRSLFAAYFVLLLHVFLLAGTGITVVLFRGVYHYLPWIMGGLAVLVIALFWIFYLKMKKSGNDIKEVLSFPEFQDRTVEIKLLGGVATMTIKGKSDQTALIGHDMKQSNPGTLRLESSEDSIERRIRELASLYGNDLITKEEYDLAKKRILFD